MATDHTDRLVDFLVTEYAKGSRKVMTISRSRLDGVAEKFGVENYKKAKELLSEGGYKLEISMDNATLQRK